MGSSGHKKVILGKDYKYVGAAGYSYNGRYYWCVQFSKDKATKKYAAPVIKYDTPTRHIMPSYGSS
jgi:hypothetical protein